MLTRFLNPVLRRTKTLFPKISISNVKYFSSDSTIDRELQDSYDGMMPRIRAIWGLRGDIDQVTRIMNDGIVAPGATVSAMVIYADLQNPLLKKYNFSARDFILGSKEAFAQVHLAIASLSFSNFVNGISTDATTADLLRSALHPRLYEACVDGDIAVMSSYLQDEGLVCLPPPLVRVEQYLDSSERQYVHEREKEKHVSAGKELKTKGVSTHMTNINVTSSSMQRICTEIAENTPSNIMYESNSRAVAAELSKLQNDIFSEKKKVENTDSTASSDNTSPKSGSQSSSSAADDSTNVEDGVGGVLLERFIYPLGSVVATVDMEFVAEEDYDTTLPDGSESKSKRTSTSSWTFVGCISGQDELDWKISSFDGY